MRRLLRIATVLACVGAAMGQPALAWAHSGLDSASPGPGQEVAPGVAVVSVTFAEPLAGDSRWITVKGPDDSVVPSGEPLLVNDDTLCAAVEPLTEGVHAVAYEATSHDGHPASGKFLFEVTSAGQAIGDSGPCQGLELPPVAAATSPESAAGSGWSTGTVALIGGVALASAALVGWLVASKRRAKPGP